MSTTSKITGREYTTFEQAYDWFNAHLFEGSLPACMLTLQARGKTRGYFHASRFVHRMEDGTTTDEIALNPDAFTGGTDKDILSTLAHEQVHLWQEHFGTRHSRSGYHNREWSRKMESIGLLPSDTGQPGGKRTGQRMSHCILDSGAFSQSAEALLATGFTLHWQSETVRQQLDVLGGSGIRIPPRDLSKVRFSCSACAQRAWAKQHAQLVCGVCQLVMQPLTSESVDHQ